MLGDAGTCRSCGAAVRWINTPAGRTMPLDVAPIEVLAEADLARAQLVLPREHPWTREPVLYRLSPTEPGVEQFERRVVAFAGHRFPPGEHAEVPRTRGLRSHFVSCEFANQHRSKP